MAGDPGLFGNLFRRGVSAAKGFLGGGPVGAAAAFVRPTPGRAGAQVQRVPGIKGLAQRIVPGGKTGLMVEGGERKRRRRMNVTNDKALRRAIRRQAGFVKLAKKALKGTGYKIVSTSSGRSRRPMTISEKGSGSVIVR
jgi:hypothetical protein